jgi:anti-sigma-K factor RskA
VDIKEYIASGILEAYLLGTLSPDEELLVAANIAKFPVLRDELAALEKAMEQYGAAIAKTPPPELEDKIWDTIQALPQRTRPSVTPSKSIEFKPPVARSFSWKYAAVLIALAGSLGANMLLMEQGNKHRDESLVLNTKLEKIRSEQGELAQQLANYQQEKAMMADTGMQTIVMHTMKKGHPMAATLYWSKDKGEAYVSIDALPPPPKGMQYQLWVMQSGKPIDMGVLSNNMANTPMIQKVGMQVSTGEAFAISLEKEGGSPTPTMENIYVMGKA